MNEKSKQSEKLVEKKLCEAVEKQQGMAIKMALVGAAGFPDRLILLPGGIVGFVECKTTGQKLRRLQGWWREKLINLGFAFQVLDHTDDIEFILKSIKYHNQ
jgi:hypothetical protein